MTEPELIIRPAGATLAEGRIFAYYADIAAEGLFRFMLGPRFQEIVASAYLEDGHDCCYKHALFASIDARIVGMAAGFTAEQQRTFSAPPFARARQLGPLRRLFVSAVLSPLSRLFDTTAEGDFYLLAIATDEALRGSGAGTALLQAMEARARAAGARRFALHVSADNEAARHFYERRGMSVLSRWPKWRMIPAPRLYHMAKAL